MANKPNRRKPVARARVSVDPQIIDLSPIETPDPIDRRAFRLESPYYGGTIEGEFQHSDEALAVYEHREAGLHKITKTIDLDAPWG